MLRSGIVYGTFSGFFFGEYPKYVWCVDPGREVYEAKTEPVTPGVYHGYRLEEE
jgi:hypothetical protein